MGWDDSAAGLKVKLHPSVARGAHPEMVGFHAELVEIERAKLEAIMGACLNDEPGIGLARLASSALEFHWLLMVYYEHPVLAICQLP